MCIFFNWTKVSYKYEIFQNFLLEPLMLKDLGGIQNYKYSLMIISQLLIFQIHGNKDGGNSLVAQWLGLRTFTAWGPHLFSGWGNNIM